MGNNGQEMCLNIGCGTAVADGWYNIDNSPTILLSRIPLVKTILKVPDWPKSVHRHDVPKGLSFKSGSVDYIYSSHTFEHFTYPQALAVTKECLRLLKPGDALRIVVPDLRKLVDDYLADPAPMASHRLISRLLLGHTWQDLLHAGAHHSQMFDSRSLLTLLKEAGFSNVQERNFGDSKIPNLFSVELESRRRESLYAEADKDL